MANTPLLGQQNLTNEVLRANFAQTVIFKFSDGENARSSETALYNYMIGFTMKLEIEHDQRKQIEENQERKRGKNQYQRSG